jgi:hypothetical protein
MALVADPGLALLCGLNGMPKRNFLSEYFSRITSHKVSQLLSGLRTHLARESVLTGKSINLDFHSVPYFGEFCLAPICLEYPGEFATIDIPYGLESGIPRRYLDCQVCGTGQFAGIKSGRWGPPSAWRKDRLFR